MIKMLTRDDRESNYLRDRPCLTPAQRRRSSHKLGHQLAQARCGTLHQARQGISGLEMTQGWQDDAPGPQEAAQRAADRARQVRIGNAIQLAGMSGLRWAKSVTAGRRQRRLPR
jgi:hypothetical protein